jgi:hypothetical protein
MCAERLLVDANVLVAPSPRSRARSFRATDRHLNALKPRQSSLCYKPSITLSGNQTPTSASNTTPPSRQNAVLAPKVRKLV